jgi:hypothetical protein
MEQINVFFLKPLERSLTPFTHWKPIGLLLLLELFFIGIEFHEIGFIAEIE